MDSGANSAVIHTSMAGTTHQRSFLPRHTVGCGHDSRVDGSRVDKPCEGRRLKGNIACICLGVFVDENQCEPWSRYTDLTCVGALVTRNSDDVKVAL